MQEILENYEEDFMEIAAEAPAVVVCRCSPTQKARVVVLLQKYAGAKRRVAAIGDGGNDVSMIQAADVGIGIEGTSLIFFLWVWWVEFTGIPGVKVKYCCLL